MGIFFSFSSIINPFGGHMLKPDFDSQILPFAEVSNDPETNTGDLI